ncbi:6-phosphofructokinase [bacterium]|nr:6-phosphofructokinase [bacterium]MBU1615656.1 6-phosphofructokinase [bacterium]
MKKVGILTGGGDAPGLNAVIRAVVCKAEAEGYEVIGIKDGWAGLLEKETMPLTKEDVAGIHSVGGTIVGTSRTNPFKTEDGPAKALKNFNELGLSALIAAGGDDTLGAAYKLFQEGLKVVGVPKTIDNDLSCTDQTFGFDTAVSIATEAIDRLHTTAKSHHRILIVEIMGRHAGWIALESGLASGAHVILIPEVKVNLDEVCEIIKRRYENGENYCLIAASEGATFEMEGTATAHILQAKELDEFGHVRLGGIGKALEKILSKTTGFEARSVVLGHLQRGGSPTAFDRNLGTRLGVKAMDLVAKEKFGQMAALYKGEVTNVDLARAVGELKTVPKELYEMAKLFFG